MCRVQGLHYITVLYCTVLCRVQGLHSDRQLPGDGLPPLQPPLHPQLLALPHHQAVRSAPPAAFSLLATMDVYYG